MSDAKFHLVPRASIIASGDSNDFHHVAPDEVVLVSVEALERVTRERDELFALVGQRCDERDALKTALNNVNFWLDEFAVDDKSPDNIALASKFMGDTLRRNLAEVRADASAAKRALFETAVERDALKAALRGLVNVIERTLGISDRYDAAREALKEEP